MKDRKFKIIKMLIFFIAIALLPGLSFAVTCGVDANCSLPDTGQAICYNAAGVPLIPPTYPLGCFTAAAVGTLEGQDGQYMKGIAWPSPRFKCYNIAGTEVVCTDASRVAITDNLTGLQWHAAANCMKTGGYANSTYDGVAGTHPVEVYGTPDAGLTDGGTTWQKALDFVAAINAGSAPSCNPTGTSDWRLPNREELYSLINAERYMKTDGTTNDPNVPCTTPGAPFTEANYGSPIKYLKDNGFTGFTQTDCDGNPPYWTSTTKKSYSTTPTTTDAYTVDIASGAIEWCPKAAACTSKYRTDTLYPKVLPVRTAPSCTDADSDGYYSTTGCGTAVDCNDSVYSINPGALDNNCNGVDENCSGAADEGYVSVACDGPDSDLCMDDTTSCTAGAIVCSTGDNTLEVCFNSIDDDCDGLTDEGCVTCTDTDIDGYGNPGDPSCPNGSATDCNDGNAAVNPGATEITNNGIDDDCNASTPTASASGNGYNYPIPYFRASMSVSATSVKYYYTRTRTNLASTSITGVSASGGTATVTGVGTVNGVAGCAFTATVTDSSPDLMGLVITPGGACTTSYSASPSAVSSGNFVVVGQ